MTELASALDHAQNSVAPPASVYVQSARLPRVPDRNQEHSAQDYEIGFLGEHYVSDPVARTIPTQWID